MALIKDTDKEFANHLIKILAGYAVSDTNSGSVAFTVGFDFEANKCLLFELLKTHKDIPEEDTTRIAKNAFYTAAATGLTLENYINEATKLERAYLSQPPVRHIFLSEISIDQRIRLQRITLHDTTITFPANIPKAFVKARNELLEQASMNLYAKPPARYRWARVSVSARSHFGAGDKALDILGLLTAIWNLGINRQTLLRTSSGKRKPVNQIHLAPIHTLHKPTGALSIRTWWYEPNYVKAIDPESKKIIHAVDLGKQIIARLKRLDYANEMEDWLRFYGRALSEYDWTNSFVLLWQALESATYTRQKRYEDTIRRTAFLFDDVVYHKRVLEILKDCRNNIVHAQSDLPHPETKLYMLKRYVESVLLFHLRNAGNFESSDEAGLFLDLPADPDALHRRLTLVKKAKRFRSNT